MLEVAGFSRATKNHPFETTVLATGGLGNCIAIVAINEKLKLASITHFDTMCSITGSGKNWVANMAVFRNLKTWIDSRTSPTTYQVGIGSVWFGMARDKGPTTGEFMRHALLMGIIKTFNFEPAVAATCIAFKDGMLEAMDQSFVEQVPGWANRGDEIPIRQINI